MHIYCKNCKKHTGNTFPKKLILISKNKIKGKSKCTICLTDRLIMQSKCSDCGIKKSRFVKEQEAKGLLSNLGIKTPLSKIPLLNVLF